MSLSSMLLSTEAVAKINVSDLGKTLSNIDSQARQLFRTFKHEDYELLESMVDNLTEGILATTYKQTLLSELATQQTATSARLSIPQLALSSDTGDSAPGEDMGIMDPLLGDAQKEEYKHQIYKCWYNMRKCTLANSAQETTRLALKRCLDGYNLQRPVEKRLNAEDLVTIETGILVSWAHPFVPDPIFHVLAYLQQHKERWQEQDEQTVVDLMRTIHLLLMYRHSAVVA
jgi:hypothetical protein